MSISSRSVPKRRRQRGKQKDSGGKDGVPVKVRLVSQMFDNTYKKRAIINGVQVRAYIDNGYQHNLISAQCAEHL